MQRENEKRESALKNALVAMTQTNTAQTAQRELQRILACNEQTAGRGLVLTSAQAAALVQIRAESLRSTGRVEFGGGITPQLIGMFADSPYIEPESYAETIGALTEIFYAFKNETMDAVSDGELLSAMRGFFDGTCAGSTELLAGREMPEYARRIRAGGRTDAE